jgi:hypothetical protein
MLAGQGPSISSHFLPSHLIFWSQPNSVWGQPKELCHYILNDDYRAVWTLANLDFEQQKVLAPDEQACWPLEGVVLSPPSQPELGPQETASVFPGLQQQYF